MKQSRIARQLIAIALISAGSGLLTQLLLPALSQGQRLLVLGCGLFAIVAYWSRRKGSQQFSSVQNLSQPQPQEAIMRDMNRYFAWIEKKLQELIEREGLHCALVRMKRGPLVITLQLRLVNPTQRDLQKLMRLGPAIAQLLQVESVRIADTAQGIMVEVPSPTPVTPNGARLARQTRGLSVAVGLDAATRPVRVNLENHGALFWVGPSRRGKTQSMKSTLYALIRANPDTLQFIIIASPAKVSQDWGVFAGAVGCLGIASSREEIANATGWLVTEMNRANGVTQDRHTILVIDDLPIILKVVPQIAEDIAEIAGMGAGLGVHLLVGSQGAGSKRTSGGTEIENNMTARILFRPSSTRTGTQSAGTSGVALQHLSSAKGDAVALIDGYETRIATAWIADRDLLLLPSAEKHPPIWQNNRVSYSEQPRTSWDGAEQVLKQAAGWQNNPKTSQNTLEQPRTSALDVQNPAGMPESDAAGRTSAAEHVPEQAPEQAITQTIARLAHCSFDALKRDNLGLDATRTPNVLEVQAIRLAFGYTQSIRKCCFIAYGHYNGKVREYVKSAIADTYGDVDDGNEQEEERPLQVIALNGFSSWQTGSSTAQHGD